MVRSGQRKNAQSKGNSPSDMHALAAVRHVAGHGDANISVGAAEVRTDAAVLLRRVMGERECKGWVSLLSRQTTDRLACWRRIAHDNFVARLGLRERQAVNVQCADDVRPALWSAGRGRMKLF